MSETTIQADTTYTIKNLKIVDIEIICLGLDSVHIPGMHDRAVELTEILEDIIPPTGSVDSE